MDIDVLIVGLGPAGATVLSKLAQMVGSEYSILGIDHRKKPGFPVQCGEFMPSPKEMAILMPNVPHALEFFTFEDKFISNSTNKISFFTPNGRMIQTPFEGFTLNRGKWNTHLVEMSIKNGAEVWTSACAQGYINENRVIVSRKDSSNVEIIPKIIVGADGVNSRIAKWMGMSEKRSEDHYVIVKQHLMRNIKSELYDSDDVQMFFGEKYAPGAYSWIIPKDDKTANVGAGVRVSNLKRNMNVSKALANITTIHPVSSQILHGAQIEETIAGVVPVGLPFQRTVDLTKNVILVGDAACQVVSSVGAGIPTSMVAGTLAARTIANYLSGIGSLDQYQVEWQKQMLPMFKSAYKLRRFFDAISTGEDSRVQWYMNRLKSGDIKKVVHCSVPWKLSLGFPFITMLNRIIK
ncbi:MAG: geranylgeranyl reductase family protein [Candidatus Hodarchaeota archaeon]